MSRLRRLVVTDRYFFVTVRLRKERAMLGDSDFRLLALVINRVRLPAEGRARI